MTIEQRFDVPLIAGLALREKQIQQNYRPIIGVHKWFARRPGTLFRGLLLAEFGEGPLEGTFFRSNDLGGIRIADPFMGGGTPLIEANRLGCDVEGFDVNPMAAWIVREEIAGIDLAAYESAARDLTAALREEVDRYYRTVCPLYGDAEVPVKSFFWVKVLECEACGASVDLFPGYRVARNVRHPRDVLVCASCGELNEVDDAKTPGECSNCAVALRLRGPAGRGYCACPQCGHVNAYVVSGRAPGHRLFGIEYHNPDRKAGHRGRFFKKPDAGDLRSFADAERRWRQMVPRFAPDEAIPAGDETNRLHRWGYRHYRELFNPRQLLGLELSSRLVADVKDTRIRRALATNLSDLLRYQNMLCRYDTMALKALDIFSVHGFPVGLVQCESNLLGISNGGRGSVGSGGWSNIVQKYVKAKAYCGSPFEVRGTGHRKERIVMETERIGDEGDRTVSIRCLSATKCELEPASVDAVLTDPPYFGNVQYAELMDFCYVWLRRLADDEAEGFGGVSCRSPDELTGNQTAVRGIAEFAEGLSDVYRRMALALKPGAPLVFTYHHNKVEPYCAAGAAMLDAGLVCSASLPCPAEMGGSIHIHGTGSSIVDTVFVCRERRYADAAALFGTVEGLVDVVRTDVGALVEGGRRPTRGDVRCMLFGQATRMAVWDLQKTWQEAWSTSRKLLAVREMVLRFGEPEDLVMAVLSRRLGVGPPEPKSGVETFVEEQVALPI